MASLATEDQDQTASSEASAAAKKAKQKAAKRAKQKAKKAEKAAAAKKNESNTTIGELMKAGGGKTLTDAVESIALSMGQDKSISLDMDQEKLAETMKALKLMETGGKKRSLRGEAAIEDAKKRPHKFWDTQPVPKLSEDTSMVEEGTSVNPILTVDDVSPDCLPLPKGFEWVSMDVTNDEQVDEIYDLLYKNYVEDDDNMFRFDYSREFLKWALQPPGYFPDWHVGVRQSNNGALRALITGIPVGVSVHGKDMTMCEINFLCVHKKLRSKRVAPTLIKEVTRRVNRRDIWQAVYTAGVVLPKPVAHARYWHRSINPQKLIEVKFSRLQPRMTMNRTIRLYKLPEEPKTAGLRPMTLADVPSARKLLATYLQEDRFQLNIIFESDEEFAHWLLPRDGVVASFVVCDGAGNVTDLCSYYHLNSTIIGNEKYKTLFAAYSFYNVATTVTLTQLMNDMLILSKKTKVDVFNLLDVMDNREELLKELKFGIGDGFLQYYLYNWRCKQVEPKNLGIVLL
jgi:glycylpeptide N-tetradecanoyltransferase|eukprot:Stramenopile-MAST_4_protein_3098